MSPEREAVTRLLRDLSGGNKQAYDALMPLVYDQLRKVASHCLAAERPGHTLRATALVHEAYLKLVAGEVEFQDRVHFYALAARMMRRILVDHARAHGRQKRGGDAERIPLDEAVMVGSDNSPELLDLDQALEKLAQLDPRKAEIIELLFFGGLTYDESAAAVGISAATLHRELKLAKAWLYRELRQEPPEQARHDSAT